MASSSIKTYIITFGEVINKATGEKCKNPTVTPAGSDDIAINCIDPEGCVYKVQVGPNDDEPCLKFIVTCDECDECGHQVIEKCFCETQDDCQDCENCTDGFCEKLCDKCCDGQCCECETNADCPCNKICVNGDCVCPPNSIENENGCCDECQNNNDCPACTRCIFKDGYKQCVPLDCPCLPELDECVECVNTGDCDGINECCVDNKCVCCPGFKLINGSCQRCECETDIQCDQCEICKDCVCQPIQCPPGEVCIDGVCVEECDCDNPDCSSRFDYCKTSSYDPNICGCVPCEGDCASGCVDPCICDPNIDRCVFNPCQGSCTNATDCPSRDCGCLDGECVPCFLLDCVSSDECERTLGCECSGNNCVPAGCPPTPCSVSSDCPFGCTCFEGICTSCDSFSCETADCELQSGCQCVGDKCEGKEEECNDTLEIEKDDENCTLTGRLIKDNCCACPALTLDSKGQIVGETDSNYTLNFISEIRKGAFNGVNVNSNPRVDDFGNAEIADNEPPTSGTISLIYEVTYNVFELIDGQEFFQGISTDAPISSQASFLSTGTSGEVQFNGIAFPKIGSRDVQGTTIRETRSIEIGFFLTTTLAFPNKCNYSGDQFAEYDIQSDSDFKAFSTTSLGNPRGGTVTSSDCRDPFFRWIKSVDSTFNELPFRKLYVEGVNNLTYEDVLTKDNEPDLESCFYYYLDVDCTCAEPPSKYIVFCNPSDLDFELEGCNKCITINSFDTCDVNEDITFRVEAGDLNFTWVGDNAPIGQQMCSSVAIEQVVFSIDCDVLDVCTKIYDVPTSDLELDYDVTCSSDNGEITVTFASVDTTGECAVDYIEIGGFTLAGSLTKTLEPGRYDALVHWKCGCDPTELTIIEDCCDFVLSPCTRECSGNIDGCQNDPGVSYTFNGGLITQSLREFVETLPAEQAATITANKGDCLSQSITIPSLNSFCCEGFRIKITQAPESITIQVFNGTGDVSVTVVSSTGIPLVVTSQGNNSFVASGLIEGEQYTVTANDGTCGVIDGTVILGECALVIDLEEFNDGPNCRYKASVEPQTCNCRDLTYAMNILSAVDNGPSFDVYYETVLEGNDAVPIVGELHIGTPDDLIPSGIIEGSGVVTIPKPAVNSENCLSSLIVLTAQDTSSNGVYDIVVDLNVNGIALINDPNIASVDVMLDNVKLNASNANNGSNQPIYLFTDFSEPNDGANIRFRLEVNATDINGTVFNFTTPTYSIAPFNTQTIAATMCEQTIASNDATVRFELRSLALEDNCEYFDTNGITTFQEYTINSNAVVVPSNQIKILEPNVLTARWVKFTWLRDGEFVYKEFSGVPDYQSILPLEHTIVGSEYEAEAQCAPCSDAEKDFLCCIPDVSVEVQSCNLGLIITLTGLEGQYYIDYDGNVYPITITASGVESVAIPGPVDASQGIVGVTNAVNCTEVFDVPLVSPCEPIVTYQCTAPTQYTATIDGCGIGSGLSSINIVGGTGSVSGNQVIGIEESNPAIVDISDSNGCLILSYLLAHTCSLTVTVSASATPTPSGTPGASQTPTPTFSPTPSPTIGSSQTPTPTISISNTPGASNTPSITPTISVSRTIGTSVTRTPSITPTISVSGTPTPTRTSSITPTPTRTMTPVGSKTPTPTRTPSQTPGGTKSVTPTRTATPTISVTKSPSRTPSRTPSITPTPSTSSIPQDTSEFCDFPGDTCGDCGICNFLLICQPTGGCDACRSCQGVPPNFFQCLLNDPQEDAICGSVCYNPDLHQCCSGGTS